MRTSSFLFVSAAAFFLAACGNKDTTTEPTLTTASSAASSGSGGASTTSTTATTASTGAGGAEPACPTCVNDCDPLKATDMTSMSALTILFGGNTGFMYSPACIKVKAGTMITWSGDFSVHPLEGGTIVDGVATPDPTSPIKPMETGTMVTYTLDKAGTFGFYCGVHLFDGAAFVQ